MHAIASKVTFAGSFCAQGLTSKAFHFYVQAIPQPTLTEFLLQGVKCWLKMAS